jgi:hypothetical protein
MQYKYVCIHILMRTKYEHNEDERMSNADNQSQGGTLPTPSPLAGVNPAANAPVEPAPELSAEPADSAPEHSPLSEVAPVPVTASSIRSAFISVLEPYEVRRANVRKLFDDKERGSMSRMSRALGYKNPAFVSQMIGSNPTREVTSVTARRIEYVYELPMGALDDPNFIPPDTKLRSVSRAEFDAMLKSAEAAAFSATPNQNQIKQMYPDLIPKTGVGLPLPPAHLKNEPVNSKVNLDSVRKEVQTESLKLATDAVRAVGQLLEQEGVAPNAQKFADLVSIVLTDAFERGECRTEHIQMLVRLMR